MIASVRMSETRGDHRDRDHVSWLDEEGVLPFYKTIEMELGRRCVPIGKEIQIWLEERNEQVHQK